MRRPLQSLALMALLALPLAPADAADRAVPAGAPMDPATARCILNNLRFAENRAAAELVREACTSLIGQGDGTDAPGGDGYLVRCKVQGDPEWIEFRLLTRGQCDAANGVATNGR
jgi:hypothetical protein